MLEKHTEVIAEAQTQCFAYYELECLVSAVGS